ncbi:putative damage-inducible protein DinB [Aeromicrobium panaciterrae]|uniref:Damage-inducible protein DinB n=1 Tax=Aeromicrobium panaciterrae TaxID=363861 RepID=A0ABU1UR97_9ACTN|nr:DUF664 domain-containing protein [Aeromicrobium panaciterrae]MDR7087723.1 putative damage-inducible protein DinB [Aeromicrobium panaciterrae]
MTPTDTPESFDERSILLQMLRYSQETAVGKVRGLSQELARTAPLPTSPKMSPANILNHLRWVEWSWIHEDLYGKTRTQEPATGSSFGEGSVLPLEDVIRLYEEQAAATLEVFAEVDLDMLMQGTLSDHPLTARWILQHLIEETARHNGHLDILREMADGSVG